MSIGESALREQHDADVDGPGSRLDSNYRLIFTLKLVM